MTQAQYEMRWNEMVKHQQKLSPKWNRNAKSTTEPRRAQADSDAGASRNAAPNAASATPGASSGPSDPWLQYLATAAGMGWRGRTLSSSRDSPRRSIHESGSTPNSALRIAAPSARAS